jgi:glycosyltransferase involved in cell wall biosynthesis
LNEAKSSGIIIVSTVRDVGRQVRKNVIRIRKSLNFFSRQMWIVTESDSSDNTLDELEKLSKKFPDFEYLSLGNLQSTITERTLRIAKSRNAAFELMKNYAQSDFPYVLLADLDGRNLDISESAIKSCFKIPDWDMCAANQLGTYYDIWGLRHSIWNPNDCWKDHEDLSEILGEDNARQIAISSKMIRLNPNLPPIQVQSAFGGLALYKRACLEGRIYSESLIEDREVCDHVDLNVRLNNLGYRLFINPKMINRIEFPSFRMFFSTPRLTFSWFRNALLLKFKLFVSNSCSKFIL